MKQKTQSDFFTPEFDKKKINDLESSRDDLDFDKTSNNDESSWFDKSRISSDQNQYIQNMKKSNFKGLKSTFGGNDTFNRDDESIEIST